MSSEGKNKPYGASCCPEKFIGEAAFIVHRRSAKRVEATGFSAFVLHDGAHRFGAVASKRMGGAVDRNRAKRRLRAAFAAVNKELITPVSVLLYAKRSVLKANFAALVADLKRILQP